MAKKTGTVPAGDEVPKSFRMESALLARVESICKRHPAKPTFTQAANWAMGEWCDARERELSPPKAGK